MQAAVSANKEAAAELKRVYAEELARLTARAADGESFKQEPEVAAMELANSRVSVPRVAITEPTRITFPEDENDEEPKIIQLAIGTRQNLAVSAQGHVYSFGTGEGGQLGQGDPGQSHMPFAKQTNSHYAEVISKPRRVKGEIEDLRVIKAAACVACPRPLLSDLPDSGGTHCMVLAVSREEPTDHKKEPKQIDAVLVIKSPSGKLPKSPDVVIEKATDEEMADATQKSDATLVEQELTNGKA